MNLSGPDMVLLSLANRKSTVCAGVWPCRNSVLPWLLVSLWLATFGSAPAQAPIDRAFTLPKGYVNQIAFSPDGKMLASLGADHEDRRASVRLWEVQTGKELAKFISQTSSPGWLLAFTPDGKSLVSSCSGPPHAWVVEVWDLPSKKPRLKIDLPPGRVSGDAAITPDSKTLIVMDQSAPAAFYDLSTGKMIGELKGIGRTVRLAMSKDGKWLVTGHSDGEVLVWNLRTRKRLWSTTVHRLGAKPTLRKGHALTTVAISSDGRQVAAANRDARVVVWDRDSGKVRNFVDLRAREFTVMPSHLAFLPGDKELVIAGGGVNWGIFLWAPTPDRIRGDPFRKEGHLARHERLALSPDGTTLATYSSKSPLPGKSAQRDIRLWDLRAPKALK